jgi:hypothetical protein
MVGFQRTSGGDPSDAGHDACEDEMAWLPPLWKANMRRWMRLRRQREAELQDYAQAGVDVLPPGAITSWIDADRSSE